MKRLDGSLDPEFTLFPEEKTGNTNARFFVFLCGSHHGDASGRRRRSTKQQPSHRFVVFVFVVPSPRSQAPPPSPKCWWRRRRCCLPLSPLHFSRRRSCCRSRCLRRPSADQPGGVYRACECMILERGEVRARTRSGSFFSSRVKGIKPLGPPPP